MLAAAPAESLPQPFLAHKLSSHELSDDDDEGDDFNELDGCIEGPNGLLLKPCHCPALGPHGRQARSIMDRAQGVWKGTVVAESEVDAAVAVARATSGTVRLDCFGAVADNHLGRSGLSCVLADEAPDFDEADADRSTFAAASVMGFSNVMPLTSFALASRPGQILSHSGDIWIAASASSSGKTSTKKQQPFSAILRLRPRPDTLPGADDKRCLLLSRDSPLGPLRETWREMPMVEFPSVLRMMLGEKYSGSSALAAQNTKNYLVEEEEEMLVCHCWRREGPSAEGSYHQEEEKQENEFDGFGRGRQKTTNKTAISMEQLLWLDTVNALAETSPCEEEPVPAARLRLAEEGSVTRPDLLSVEEYRGEAEAEDAPRFASLAFLHQFLNTEVLEREVLPFLMPNSAGDGAEVRVFSASLSDDAEAEDQDDDAKDSAMMARSSSKGRPASLDDLFHEDVDFRIPAPWATASSTEQDPLKGHELTSVMLLNEHSGFLLTFHCLQTPDPCA